MYIVRKLNLPVPEIDERRWDASRRTKDLLETCGFQGSLVRQDALLRPEPTWVPWQSFYVRNIATLGVPNGNAKSFQRGADFENPACGAAFNYHERK